MSPLNGNTCTWISKPRYSSTNSDMGAPFPRNTNMTQPITECVARLLIVLVAPLHCPSLRRSDSVRIVRVVANVARPLHLAGIAALRGGPEDLCAGVVVAAFFKTRRL